MLFPHLSEPLDLGAASSQAPTPRVSENEREISFRGQGSSSSGSGATCEHGARDEGGEEGYFSLPLVSRSGLVSRPSRLICLSLPARLKKRLLCRLNGPCPGGRWPR